MACPVRTEEGFLTAVTHTLDNEFTNHVDKLWMCANCRRPHNVQANFLTELHSFGVQIIQDFHVIGDKSKRRDHHICNTVSFECSQMFQNIRL